MQPDPCCGTPTLSRLNKTEWCMVCLHATNKPWWCVSCDAVIDVPLACRCAGGVSVAKLATGKVI